MDEVSKQLFLEVISNPPVVTILMIELAIFQIACVVLIAWIKEKHLYLNGGTEKAFTFKTKNTSWLMYCLSMKRFGFPYFVNLTFLIYEWSTEGITPIFFFFLTMVVALFLLGYLFKPEITLSKVGVIIFDPLGMFSRLTRRGGLVWSSIKKLEYVESKSELRMLSNAGMCFKLFITPSEVSYLKTALSNNQVDINIDKK